MARKSNELWEIHVQKAKNWKSEFSQDFREMTFETLKQSYSKLRKSAVNKLNRMAKNNLLGISQAYSGQNGLKEKLGLSGDVNNFYEVLAKPSSFSNEKELLKATQLLYDFHNKKTSNMEGVRDYLDNLKSKSMLYREIEKRVKDERLQNKIISELHNIVFDNRDFITGGSELQSTQFYDYLDKYYGEELTNFFDNYETELFSGHDYQTTLDDLSRFRQRVEDVILMGLNEASKTFDNVGYIEGGF